VHNFVNCEITYEQYVGQHKHHANAPLLSRACVLDVRRQTIEHHYATVRFNLDKAFSHFRLHTLKQTLEKEGIDTTNLDLNSGELDPHGEAAPPRETETETPGGADESPTPPGRGNELAKFNIGHRVVLIDLESTPSPEREKKPEQRKKPLKVTLETDNRKVEKPAQTQHDERLNQLPITPTQAPSDRPERLSKPPIRPVPAPEPFKQLKSDEDVYMTFLQNLLEKKHRGAVADP
jgi:hypothetical protein